MSESVKQMSTAEYSLLRWRARRGLLENDILLERFFLKYPSLTQQQGLALTHILNLTDRVLMDLLMNKAAIPDELKAGFVRMDETLMDSNDSHDSPDLSDPFHPNKQITQFKQLPEIDRAMEQAIQKMIEQLQDI